jgi:polar amino acid transport system substrate-binding protein
MKYLINMLAIMILLTGNAFANKHFKQLSKYQILAEEYRPYNYLEDGKATGINTEILQRLIKKFKVKLSTENVKFASWPETYKTALNSDNFILMSIVKSEEREKLFKWVGPIIDNEIVMVSHKNSHVKFSERESLDDYKLGVVANDIASTIAEKFIKKKNLNLTDNVQQLIKKLDDQRIDFAIYDKTSFFNNIAFLELNPEDYIVVKTFGKVEQYFAFSKNTPDETITEMQQYLNYFKSSDKYQALLKKYNLSL